MAITTAISWCDSTFNPVRGCTKVSPGCAGCYAARDSVRFPNIRGIWGNSGTRIVGVQSYWQKPLQWNKTAAVNHLEANVYRANKIEVSPEHLATLDHRPRVFCASLGDIFEDWQGPLHLPDSTNPTGITPARWDGDNMGRHIIVPRSVSSFPLATIPATMDHMRWKLFDLIRRTPHLDWLLLTKRPEKVMRMLEYATMIARQYG